MEGAQQTEQEATKASKLPAVEAEIQQLKEKYGNSCKVIRDIGCYDFIVKVHLEDYDVGIKFQMKDYPNTRPLVILTWKYLDTSLQDGLHALMLNENTITNMILAADNWLKDHTELLSKPSSTRNRKNKKERKPKQKVKVDQEEEISVKKPSMKTAIDVISRIRWDASLQTDEFTVGYIDRFVGITEKSFSVLSWDDVAEVDDYEALAIPKHRIEYFKFKELKVWDKPSRTDNVFGSSGKVKMTIYDVIENYDQLLEASKPKTDLGRKNVQIDQSSDSDSDDDDNIKVIISSNPNHNSADNDSDAEIPWQNKLRPNYFVALRITDDDIHSMVDHVQEVIITRQSLYAQCCIPITALHVTLCTLRLDTPQLVSDAVLALREFHDDLKVLKSTLKLDGIGSFNSRVLYAKVHYDDAFLKLVDTIKLALRTAGIELLDGQDFIPHMTIMKTSRPVSRIIGSRQIPKSIYLGSEDVTFGEQRVENIHLCSIEEAWGNDGFYSTPLKLDL